MQCAADDVFIILVSINKIATAIDQPAIIYG